MVDNRDEVPGDIRKRTKNWFLIHNVQTVTAADEKVYDEIVKPKNVEIKNWAKHLGKVWGVALVDGKTYAKKKNMDKTKYPWANVPRTYKHRLLIKKLWILDKPVAYKQKASGCPRKFKEGEKRALIEQSSCKQFDYETKVSFLLRAIPF